MTNSVHQQGWVSSLRLGTASAALALAVVLVLGVATTRSVQAQTFTTLYNFCPGGGLPCPDGAFPQTSVVQDGSGNLYGTTHYGGLSSNGGYGHGVVFEMSRSGAETVLHKFTGSPDGAGPNDLLRDAAGNLYGTAANGGSVNSSCPYGCGVVFKIDTTGKETVLYTFSGGATDGCVPTGGLIQDKVGKFYGTTSFCGASGHGTVFKLNKKGGETLLHSFAGGAMDGATPAFTTPLMDKEGNLYGTTGNGGPSDNGVVYKLSKAGRLTVLYSFAGGITDGCNPYGTPAMDGAGALYGTTIECGSFSQGTVWKVTKKGA
jgi:uncharacterized repeat protein (TIGR03803 family)